MLGLQTIIRIFAAFLLLTAIESQAGSIIIVNSGDSELYSRFSDSFSEALKSSAVAASVNILSVDSYKTQHKSFANKNITAIVAAGIEAAIAVSHANNNLPMVLAMLPKQGYTVLNTTGALKCPESTCRVIFLDQPVKRQLLFLRHIASGTKQIAILSSDKSRQLTEDITQTARELEFISDIITVKDQDSILPALKQNLAKSDVLMAIPDPVVYNQHTARAILLTAFHHRVPLFAYSRSYIAAGATFGLYSTPENIARQVADLFSSNGIRRQNESNEIYPKYFTIDINRRAADALGLSLPDADDIYKLLSADEIH